MRRKTVRTLAHVGRAAALGLCLAAVGTAAFWQSGRFETHWQSGWVGGLDHWLRDRAAGAERELAAALAIDDPVLRQRALQDLLADLADVRALDRLAPVVVACRQQLAEHLAHQGDVAGETALQQDAVAFDPLDLAATARLHELRCRQPDTAAAALQGLNQLVAASPASPAIVVPLVRALAHLGRHEDALAVLGAAARVPCTNDWRVSCRWNGRWTTPMPVGNVGGADALRLCFVVPAGTLGVRLFAPAHASFVLRQASLDCRSDEVREWLDVVHPYDAVGFEPMQLGLLAYGCADASFLVGTTLLFESSCTFTARLESRPSRLLAQAVLSPEFAAWGSGLAGDSLARANWATWRAHALANVPIGLTLDGRRHIAAIVCHDDHSFTATWGVGSRTDTLSFDLPPGRAIHPWRTIEVRDNGRLQHLDVTTSAGLRLHDVERSERGLLVTGPRPRVDVPLPVGVVSSVTVRGSL